MSSSRNLPRAFLFFLILATVANLSLVAPYLLALFLGWMLAMIMSPIYGRLRKKKIKAYWASFVSTLIVTFTIIIPVGVFTALTIQSLAKVIKTISQKGLSPEILLAKIEAVPMVSRFFEDREALLEQLQSIGQSVVEFLTKFISTNLGNAPEVLLQLTLALLTCFFVLVDGPKLAQWMSPRIPLAPEVKEHLSKSLTDTAVSSFWATVAAAFAQACVILLGFFVLGVPMKTLAFGMAFIFAWLPIVGVTPVWILGVIYLVVENKVGSAFGLAGFGLLAGVTDNVVRPWIIRGSADIHPLISLLVIFGAIQYFGIIGVFVGPVIAAALIAFLEIWPTRMKDLGLEPKEL